MPGDVSKPEPRRPVRQTAELDAEASRRVQQAEVPRPQDLSLRDDLLHRHLPEYQHGRAPGPAPAQPPVLAHSSFSTRARTASSSWRRAGITSLVSSRVTLEAVRGGKHRGESATGGVR